MSKLILVGAVLFSLGVVVGRASALPAPATPAAAATPAVAAPPALGGTEARPGGVLRGKVAEVLQVPQYTYLRLESGEWAAVESAPSLAVGAPAVVLLQNEMLDFASPSLGRTFARLWFGTLEGALPGARAQQPVGAGQPPAPRPALPRSPSGPPLTLRVADVYAERAALGGQRVRVKGTVDRVNLVQGVHYAHLKDGSGAAAEKTDDLLCISSAALPKGEPVTIEGVVALDKNVGMGVNPVVLDEAQLLP